MWTTDLRISQTISGKMLTTRLWFYPPWHDITSPIEKQVCMPLAYPFDLNTIFRFGITAIPGAN